MNDLIEIEREFGYIQYDVQETKLKQQNLWYSIGGYDEL